MPPNRSVRRRPRRSRFVRKPKTNRYRRRGMLRMLKVPRTKALFPPRMKVKLRYTDTFVAQTNGITANWVQYRLNGLYSPFVGAGGHQPRGFDQICPTLYTTYTVTGAKVLIEGRFENTNLNGDPITGQLYVGAQQTSGVHLPTSWGEALETKEFNVITRTDQQYVRYRRYFDIARIIGVPRHKLLYNSNYNGDAAANPAVGATLSVGFIEAHPNQVINFNYSLTIVYYVEFYGPSFIPPS